MKSFSRWILALAIAWPHAAAAQAPAPARGGELPAGHPPVAGGQTALKAPVPSGLPAGHPPVTGAAQRAAPMASSGGLPAGHPPVAGPGQTAPPAPSGAATGSTPPGGGNPQAADPHPAAPHGGMNAARDLSNPDASVPKGSIVATIVDGAGQPLAGVPVRLGKTFQSIAEGDQSDSETRTTNAQGEVRFSNLEASSRFSYRISVAQSSAQYSTAPFRLAEDRGQRVLLHVYPVTSDIAQARVAMRGLVYVEPRDDVFQFEIWLQVYNLGNVTWVPAGVSMQLPEGSKAFSPRESMSDTRAETDGDSRVKLLGTFSPGQHDVRFNFQVPNPQEAAVAFQLTLPPRVGEFRVVAAAAKGMSLSARDFPPVQVSIGPQGERVLVTQQRAQERGIDTVHFELAGLPTRGSAPWLAVLLAAATAASGVYVASQSPSPNRGRRRKLSGDLKKARDVLLDELVQLERAKATGKLGPQSYEQTRRALITALARIVQPSTSG
ncbi:MAG TPA: hypothetical protein VFU02_14965 [Polyangiaceae bacterium]|nr:hypothetical protein [Polyangiaceae bacterium]